MPVLQKHGPTKLDNSSWINFIFSLSLNKFSFALHEILQKGSIWEYQYRKQELNWSELDTYFKNYFHWR